jgi:hypothetical protein
MLTSIGAANKGQATTGMMFCLFLCAGKALKGWIPNPSMTAPSSSGIMQTWIYSYTTGFTPHGKIDT